MSEAPETPTVTEQHHGFIEQAKINAVLGKPNKDLQAKSAFEAAVPLIDQAFHTSWVWHGTGRYQYDPKDRNHVRDVLQTIISENGLVPHTDTLDFTRGKMESISTSPARLYSLMYAQSHYPKGETFFNDRRNGLIWAYYLAPMAWRAVADAYINKDPNYVAMLDTDTRDAFFKRAGGWQDKFTRTRVTKMDMLGGGVCDIPGNYPLIIGVQAGSFKPGKIGRFIDKHELRSETPIQMVKFTHIEVPEVKVDEVSGILKRAGRNVPIYPIEWVNEFTKRLPLKTILDGVN